MIAVSQSRDQPKLQAPGADAVTVRPSNRLVSLDAYRGFVMLHMMADVLQVRRIAPHFPQSAVWQFLRFHSDHVPWAGASLYDLIQPSFSFLVGVALPFSITSRLAHGQGTRTMILHALWRALVLVLLGVFLRSLGSPETNWTFEDTLTQIGLGYPFLFLLGLSSERVQWTALAAILVGYWLAWALYPVPGPYFDYASVGVPAEWPYHAHGFAAHWNKNSNVAAAFDQWFLNLFPRSRPFVANVNGYLTLSFIPTLGTMILGLIAGGWLRRDLTRRELLWRLVLAGVVGIALGLLLQVAGICPIVKRSWTPSWTLYSGGWCFLLLGGFYTVIEVYGWRRWAFPLVVIGMNSIAAYLMAHLIEIFIADSFKTHLGQHVFEVFGGVYAPLLQGVAVLAVLWLILLWMYQRRLFLRV